MKSRRNSMYGVRDAYRQLGKENPGYLLAFGMGEFFLFFLAHARTVKDALPDMELTQEFGCDAIRVHSLAFFPFCARLKAKGLKVATVARRITTTRKVLYSISGRSDD